MSDLPDACFDERRVGLLHGRCAEHNTALIRADAMAEKVAPAASAVGGGHSSTVGTGEGNGALLCVERSAMATYSPRWRASWSHPSAGAADSGMLCVRCLQDFL